MLNLTGKELRPINGKQTEFRIYTNSLTGGNLTTYFLRKDKFDNTWWAFEDLFSIPFIRQVASKKVIDLYGHGLSLSDIKSHTGQLKGILKSNSAEKYEQAYAKVLELENLTDNLADPVRQSLGLCTVYLLMNDESPESWTERVSNEKMSALALDPESTAFFLNWWIEQTKHFGALLKGLSQIASIASQPMEVPLN